jgi:hypothetical protein
MYNPLNTTIPAINMLSVKQILVLACCLAAAATAALAPTAAAAEYSSLADAVAAAGATDNLSTLIAAVQVSPYNATWASRTLHIIDCTHVYGDWPSFSIC